LNSNQDVYDWFDEFVLPDIKKRVKHVHIELPDSVGAVPCIFIFHKEKRSRMSYCFAYLEDGFRLYPVNQYSTIYNRFYDTFTDDVSELLSFYFCRLVESIVIKKMEVDLQFRLLLLTSDEAFKFNHTIKNKKEFIENCTVKNFWKESVSNFKDILYQCTCRLLGIIIIVMPLIYLIFQFFFTHHFLNDCIKYVIFITLALLALVNLIPHVFFLYLLFRNTVFIRIIKSYKI
jgi:hypothetical protein